MLDVADTAGTITTDLTTRYGGGQADCVTFANAMSDAWTNFYSVKKANYDTTGLLGRADTAEGNMNTFEGDITTVGNTFTSVLTNLQGIASSITDPQYGLIAGFNCAIFG